eukprot:CAMPEP_0114440168 /NCGR_PEP_ID=MMETSP0103-20121206/15618_1 /TAXON_ID=37642 ORGANISM="Paraphysomonas imperforata, Strain PA2" /NCGR_SAMPLE_ID=MMETSP0103 /ASSEMBLY_ACC=CAM_ASM_000201 /LENGTH=161 /DNA_ID=CAMNT_0001611039 /DNA_START=71 /DNA_END=556 /DNA_ORIENTATION=-
MPEVSDQAEPEPIYDRSRRRDTIDLGVVARKGKTVSFNIRSKVVLIPTRQEYQKHDLASDMWWHREDYSCFKAMARLEVLDILHKHNGDLRRAMAELFQPEGHVNDEGVAKPAAAAPCVAVAIPVAHVKHCESQQHDVFCTEPQKPIHDVAPVHPLALMAA